MLEAAWRLLADRQVGDLNMEDVAREASVSKATLYRHYPTREVLIEAMMRAGAERLSARLRDQIPPEGAAICKLQALIDLVFDLYEDRQFNVNLWMSLPGFPWLQEELRRTMDFPARVRAILEQGVQEGVFRPHDLDYAVQAVLALISPVTLKQTFEALACKRSQLEEEVVGFVLDGLRAS